MELFRDVLINIIENAKISAIPSEIDKGVEAVEMACYKTLQRIKAHVENNELSDFECIEEIVRELEDIGSNGGDRYDFG